MLKIDRTTEIVSQNLKKLRINSELTHKELSYNIYKATDEQIDWQTLRNYERLKTYPNTKTLAILSYYYKIDVVDFFSAQS